MAENSVHRQVNAELIYVKRPEKFAGGKRFKIVVKVVKKPELVRKA